MMKYPHTRGFTVFLAMLIASLALAVGAAIFDITVRELALSTTQTQSQYAIYAADTGAECALYWDSQFKLRNDADNSAFATSSDYVYGGTAAATEALCNNNDIVAGSVPRSAVWSVVAPDNLHAATTFYISMGSSLSSPCADVVVSKSASQFGRPVSTTVSSHGYNTCNLSDPNRVERVLQVNY